MAALSGDSVAQILYQAGFRDQDLVKMLAIAKRESGWTPDAHRTDQDRSKLSGDRGLLQINSVWDAQLRQAGIIQSAQDLFDPATNARAAAYVLSKQGWAAWGMGANGWAAGGDPSKGTDMNEATQIVQRMSTSGAITQSPGGAVATSGAPATDNGPITVPSDMTMIAVKGRDGVERIYAIKVLAPGVHISYSVPFDGTVQFDGARIQHIDQATSDATYGRGIMAGDAAELAGVTRTFGSFGKMWDSVIGNVMGYNNPAKDDPEVLAILAEFAGRPDMSEAELQNKLQATQWYQKRSEGELEWNSLSEQERKTRIDEMAARMTGTVFQFAGEDVDVTDPRIANHLEAVASGRLGFGAWTQIIKEQAGGNSESPWGRQVRDEQETQRQRPIDIENTSQRVREATQRWGVTWSAETIQRWAKDMVEKRSSDEDLIGELKKQAQVLYPWKDPEVETATAASPWLETYRRVMEKSATINTAEVAKALQAGQGVFDFETQLKKSAGWLETKNGRDEMYSTISEMGRMMGYA